MTKDPTAMSECTFQVYGTLVPAIASISVIAQMYVIALGHD